MKTKIHSGRVAALLALAGCFALCTAGASTFTFKSGAIFEGEVVEFKLVFYSKIAPWLENLQQ